MNSEDYYRKHLTLYMACFLLGFLLIGVFIFHDRNPALLIFGMVYIVLSFVGILYFSENEKK